MLNIRINGLLSALDDYREAVLFELNDTPYVVGRGERKLYDLVNEWCENKLGCSYDEVLIASPKRISELCKLITEEEHLDNIYVNELESVYTKFSATSRGIGDYIPSERYTGIDYVSVFGDEFSCPYCNLTTLTLSGYEEESCEFDEICNLSRASQLDHFFVKSKYPIFCLSIYNLIPVCGTCNAQKGDVDFLQNPLRRKEISCDAKFEPIIIKDIDKPKIMATFFNELEFQSRELGLQLRYSNRSKKARWLLKNIDKILSRHGRRLIEKWSDGSLIDEIEESLGYKHEPNDFWEYEYSKLYYDFVEFELQKYFEVDD